MLNLFDSGCTIPFVARYRKEKTGELNEVQLEDIQKLNKQFVELEKRKVAVLDSKINYHKSYKKRLKVLNLYKNLKIFIYPISLNAKPAQ